MAICVYDGPSPVRPGAPISVPGADLRVLNTNSALLLPFIKPLRKDKSSSLDRNQQANTALMKVL